MEEYVDMIYFVEKTAALGAGGINYYCQYYNQSFTTAKRWCSCPHVVKLVGAVNDRNKDGKQIRIAGCKGCEHYGKRNVDVKRPMTDSDVEKIKSGRDLLEEDRKKIQEEAEQRIEKERRIKTALKNKQKKIDPFILGEDEL